MSNQENSMLRKVVPLVVTKSAPTKLKDDSKPLSVNDQDNEYKTEASGASKTQMSITERMHSMYKNQNIRQQEVLSPAMSKALQDDPEEHRVMYKYLFSENKRKDSEIQPLNVNQVRDQRYISALNTRRNPDILIPGAKFLKGNQYFRNVIDDTVKEKEKEIEEAQNESMDEEVPLAAEDDDAFEKMKNQLARYYTEENITIKCRNCRQFGHMQKDCSNETKRQNCILCGKDTHDSFNCSAKLCFKCNKVGHTARECKETNIVKCGRCQNVGHKDSRCLKIWPGNYSDQQMKLAKCMQCGERGHFKCREEKDSWKLEINTHVANNLDEFFKTDTTMTIKNEDDDIRKSFDYVEEIHEDRRDKSKRKTSPGKNGKRLFDNTNVLIPEQYGDNDSNGKSSKQKYSDFDDLEGVPRHHREHDVYCCNCGEKHNENSCPSAYSNKANQKYQQFEKVRQKLAGQQDYNSYYNNNNYNYQRNDQQRDNYQNYSNYNNNNRRNDNHHVRLGDDPRKSYDVRKDLNVKPRDRDDKWLKQLSSDNESSDDNQYNKKSQNNKKKAKKNQKYSSDSDGQEVGQWDEESDYSDSGSEELLQSFTKNFKKHQKYEEEEVESYKPYRTVSYNYNDKSRSRSRDFKNQSGQRGESKNYRYPSNNNDKHYHHKKSGGNYNNNYKRRY